MVELSNLATEQERITKTLEKLKILIPLPALSVFKAPQELEFVGQGFFKIVFKYGNKAIKYYRFGPIDEGEMEKLQALSAFDTFENLYFWGKRWVATEFISGKNLRGRELVLGREAVEKVFADFQSCLDLGWVPQDLHFGNFLLEPSGRVRCIDVDLFRDIRRCDAQKRARIRRKALARLGAVQQKMLRLVRDG